MSNKVLYICTNCGGCGFFDDQGEEINICAGYNITGFISTRKSKEEGLAQLKQGWNMNKEAKDRRDSYQRTLQAYAERRANLRLRWQHRALKD